MEFCCPSNQVDAPPYLLTGTFEVGVHIADVSYFVPEGSSLDKVAAERATSVYLVQKVQISFEFLDFTKCTHLVCFEFVKNMPFLNLFSDLVMSKVWA